MGTVYEVSINATNNGKEHTNVFHVWDGPDTAVMLNILNTFVDEYCTPLLPVLSTLFTFDQITIKSLTALNPGSITQALFLTGTAVGEAMPTGVHVFIKLISGDISFRSGGKMLGGSIENEWVLGEPTNVYLDFVQTVFTTLIAQLPLLADVALSIYRPTLSFPGLPQISIAPSALVRGNSTNNRRRKPFERG